MPNGDFGTEIERYFPLSAKEREELEKERMPFKQLTSDEYLYMQIADERISEWMAGGFWTEEEGMAAWDLVGYSMRISGITPQAYLYEQVWEPVAKQRGAEEAQMRGITGLQEAQRGRVLEARGHYESMKKSILETDWTYEDKESSLLNLFYSYQEEAMLPGTTPQDVAGELFATLSPEERQKRVWGLPEMARRPRPEAPRYEPAFEQMRAGLQPQPWREWFERSYSRLLSQYKLAEREPTEKGWAEYLKRKKPELKEEWWGRGAGARGERPAAFAPRITTVRW